MGWYCSAEHGSMALQFQDTHAQSQCYKLSEAQCGQVALPGKIQLDWYEDESLAQEYQVVECRTSVLQSCYIPVLTQQVAFMVPHAFYFLSTRQVFNSINIGPLMAFLMKQERTQTAK